ncbi:MAG: ester cyclase [Acidimicrobiia bacterium]|nr:ester cyclase [Acidimicrobiia bacterium]
MSRTAESRQVVVDMVRHSMIDGDVDAAIAAYAPDVAYHSPMLRDLPPDLSPLDAIRQFMGATKGAFSDFAYTVEAVVAEDDTVAVLYRWSGTNDGPLGGLPPTGRHVSSAGAIVCRVADGRIVEQWDIDDRLDVLSQLGLLPPLEA